MYHPFKAETIERISAAQTRQYNLTLAERIAVKYESALGMAKHTDYPPHVKTGEMLAREYENQLRLLAEYDGELEACYPDDPPTMRLYDANEKLLEELEDITAWLGEIADEPDTSGEQADAAFGTLDLSEWKDERNSRPFPY